MANGKKLILGSLMRKAMLLAFFPVLLAGLSACSASDGANGLNGAKGNDGQPAPSTALALLPQAEVTVNSVKVDTSNPNAPAIKTTFTPVKDSMYPGGLGAINPTDASRLRYLRFAYARLKAPAANSGNTVQWVGYSSSGDRTPAHLTDNHNGTFTMTTPISAADYNAAMPTRLLLMVSAVTDAAAPLNVIKDFVPNGSTASISRDLVPEEACRSCHGNLEGSQYGISGAHGGSRYKLAACVVCHTDPANSAANPPQGVAGRAIQTLIHQIHSSINATTIAAPRTGFDDWSKITYPQNIKFCAACHMAPAANASNFQTPTIEACVTCHTTLDFATGTNHPGGVATNADCAGCHVSGSAKKVAAAHDTTLTGQNVPEFDVTLTINSPNNGSYYTSGDNVLVTATLKNHATGDPVPSSLYTTPADAPGTTNNILTNAKIYIYGPRDGGGPVLATNTLTDGSYDPSTLPTQAHELFVGGSDPQVETDATGFKYRLLGDAGTLTPGTYMVRVRFADYGVVSEPADYQIESTKYMTIQVGTTTVEPKISGNACTNCHGASILLTHLPYFSVVFNTDECLSCHDKSGNSTYLGNRVHAIHRGSITGDMSGFASHAEVTFPQQVNNCRICHTNAAAQTPVWRIPDMLLCGGCHGAKPNALLNDYQPVDAVQFNAELAAAQHMQLMGGDTDPLTPPTLACLVCHGEGRIADTFVAHRLITFPLPVGQ